MNPESCGGNGDAGKRGGEARTGVSRSGVTRVTTDLPLGKGSPRQESASSFPRSKTYCSITDSVVSSSMSAHHCLHHGREGCESDASNAGRLQVGARRHSVGQDKAKWDAT